MCYPPTDENVAVARSAAPAPASDGFARRGRLRALNGVYIDSSASRRYRRRGDDRGVRGVSSKRARAEPSASLKTSRGMSSIGSAGAGAALPSDFKTMPASQSRSSRSGASSTKSRGGSDGPNFSAGECECLVCVRGCGLVHGVGVGVGVCLYVSVVGGPSFRH